MIAFHLKIDPATLSQQALAEKWRQLSWVLRREADIANGNPYELLD